MKQKTVVIIVALVVFVAAALTARYGFTTVRIEDAVTAQEWDPVAFTDQFWSSKVIPASERAAELSTILSEIKPDANGMISKDSLIPIANRYGVITVGEAHVYMVKGNGRIVNINAESSRGTVEVALDGYSGPIKALIYIGPRITDHDRSIMYASGVVDILNEFPPEAGMTGARDVTVEIEKRIQSEVLGKLDRDNLLGKTISFTGAFSIPTFNRIQIDLKEIHIAPVELEVSD